MGWAERAALRWCGTCCVGAAAAARQRVAAVAPDVAQLIDWRGFANASSCCFGHFRQKATAIELARTRGIRLAN
jgi:hypothetical protein